MQTKIRGLNSDGNEIDIDASDTGALVVAQEGSAFEQAVSRGSVYCQAAQATVTTQAGLSATTPAMTIANNPGSGKKVKLWYVGAGSLVSPTAAAEIWLAYGIYSATIVTATTPSVTCINAKTGIVGAPSGIGVLVVATLPAAPLGIALLGGQASSAVTLTEKNFHCSRWLNGSIWLPEGCNVSVQTSTATTLFCDCIFEVVDA